MRAPSLSISRISQPAAAALCALALAAPLFPAQAATVRLKDLVEVQGLRGNELFGYGLVVGLAGTGDTEQTGFTAQTLAGMLGRFGTRLDRKDIHVRNVAAVMVTARIAAQARPGTRIDVSVSSLGNARSLSGGVLLSTPLQGPDGEIYAVAQGSVQTGGFDAESAGSVSRKNHPTAGRIPTGATIEREVKVDLGAGALVLQLRRPDATNASRIAAGINAVLGSTGGARPLDVAAVEVKSDLIKDPVELLAKIEAIEIDSDVRARVVVSERTGTVVAGERVRLRPALVAHGGLTVNVSQTPIISQPGALSRGSTVSTSAADITATEQPGKPMAVPATTTVDELVKALGTLGATPRDLIAILQALQAAGALDAELEVI
jgi:flagellar P-ring protein precursor FlgI